jgi:protein TonB
VAVLPFLLTAISVNTPIVREETLNLELFSMVAERIAEETPEQAVPGIPDIPPAPAPPVKPVEPVKPLEPEKTVEETPREAPVSEPVIAPAPETSVEEMPVSVFESPVVIPIPAVTTNATPAIVDNTGGLAGSAGAAVSAPLAGGSGGGGSDAAARRGGGKTGSGGTGEANPLNIYIASVANRLQANLVYPEKMRRGGIEAVTSIAFTVTESGQIKRGTLEVRKSSGYREMDDNALRAARESAPFDKPPKEMTLVIAVAFEIQRSRR